MAGGIDLPRIGVGGWAYLPGKHQNKLIICSRLYDFVEVNSTFYKLPPLKLVEKWRSSVEENFEFSVRANRKLTHEKHLEPVEENYSEYTKNQAVCEALRASVLHFQFPRSFEISKSVISNWRDFFSTVGPAKRTRIAFEVRNKPSASSSILVSFLSDFDIIPSGDPSTNDIGISNDSKIQYSRVFGPGEHTKWSFSTSELESLKEKVMKTPGTKRYLTFHNMTMYEDGARMRAIVRPGGSEPRPRVSALESMREALVAERISYPIAQSELSSRLGWRIVGSEGGQRIHADEVIKEMPESASFDSLDEVLRTYRRFLTGQSN